MNPQVLWLKGVFFSFFTEITSRWETQNLKIWLGCFIKAAGRQQPHAKYLYCLLEPCVTPGGYYHNLFWLCFDGDELRLYSLLSFQRRSVDSERRCKIFTVPERTTRTSIYHAVSDMAKLAWGRMWLCVYQNEVLTQSPHTETRGHLIPVVQYRKLKWNMQLSSESMMQWIRWLHTTTSRTNNSNFSFLHAKVSVPLWHLLNIHFAKIP